MVRLKRITFLLCLIGINSIYGQVPGGLSIPPTFWIKANSGTGATASGDLVTTWADNSSIGADVLSQLQVKLHCLKRVMSTIILQFTLMVLMIY
ncbi:MAG: hypothetical protein JKY54_05560 [Flavobacteriales bacterium]|nr:hypothetical protein [Flavobacteriales bacterium]